jgi:undecaprenyl-diphosphatase
MMIATSTVTWVPIGLMLLWVIYRNTDKVHFFYVILMFALCVLISDQVCSSIVKPLVHRPRPSNDPLYMYVVDVVNGYRGGRFSFYSGHASNTFTVAVFFSYLLRDKKMTILLISWAILNCYTRIYLGVHFFGDIMVGTFFGLLWGSLLYFLYLKKLSTPLLPQATSERTRSGFMRKDLQLLSACILLNYCLIFVAATL